MLDRSYTHTYTLSDNQTVYKTHKNRQDKTKQDQTRQDKTRSDKTRHNKIRPDIQSDQTRQSSRIGDRHADHVT